MSNEILQSAVRVGDPHDNRLMCDNPSCDPRDNLEKTYIMYALASPIHVQLKITVLQTYDQNEGLRKHCHILQDCHLSALFDVAVARTMLFCKYRGSQLPWCCQMSSLRE